MCVCSGRLSGEGGVDERIGSGLYQTRGNRVVLDVCLCLGCGGVCGVGGSGLVTWPSVYDDGVVLCLCVL